MIVLALLYEPSTVSEAEPTTTGPALVNSEPAASV